MSSMLPLPKTNSLGQFHIWYLLINKNTWCSFSTMCDVCICSSYKILAKIIKKKVNAFIQRNYHFRFINKSLELYLLTTNQNQHFTKLKVYLPKHFIFQDYKILNPFPAYSVFTTIEPEIKNFHLDINLKHLTQTWLPTFFQEQMFLLSYPLKHIPQQTQN